MKVKVAQSCPTLSDCIVHGILQARILEWVAFPFSRGSSQPRDHTQASHIAGRFFTVWAINRTVQKNLPSSRTWISRLKVLWLLRKKDEKSPTQPDTSSWNFRTQGQRDLKILMGFPDSSVGKESACNVGNLGSIPGLGRSSGEGKGYPLQYSGLEDSVNCIDHGVAKSRTRLSDFHFTSLLRVVQNWFRWPRMEPSWIHIQPVSVGSK